MQKISCKLAKEKEFVYSTRLAAGGHWKTKAGCCGLNCLPHITGAELAEGFPQHPNAGNPIALLPSREPPF